MQPYFFPYLGYFSLIAASDLFVIFDPVQYIRHGWVNRNRILKPGFHVPQYITVPLVKHSRDTSIRQIRVASGQGWKDRICGQIQHYNKRAPFFIEVRSILERCFTSKTDRIVDLNVHCLEVVCQVLELNFNFKSFAEIESLVKPVKHSGEWALNVSAALGAQTYLNPIGGKDIFDYQEFSKRGIELEFVQNHLAEYPQKNQQFVPGLSILDVLMFNGIENTNRLINDFQLTKAEPASSIGNSVSSRT